MNEHGSRSVPNDELVPRALVERLLAQEDPFSPGPDRPRLFVGRLPQSLPVDLAVPEGFEVLGGRTVSEGPRSDEDLEVVLDATMSASEALDAYRTRLLDDGWSEPERREMGHGGFGFRPGGETALFCRSDRAGQRSSCVPETGRTPEPTSA